MLHFLWGRIVLKHIVSSISCLCNLNLCYNFLPHAYSLLINTTHPLSLKVFFWEFSFLIVWDSGEFGLGGETFSMDSLVFTFLDFHDSAVDFHDRLLPLLSRWSQWRAIQVSEEFKLSRDVSRRLHPWSTDVNGSIISSLFFEFLVDIRLQRLSQ